MAKTTQNDLSGLLLSVYRAARELPLNEFHGSALELIRPWLKFDTSMWGSGSVGENGLVDIHHVNLFREPPEMLRDYTEVSHEDKAVHEIVKSSGGTLNFKTSQKYQGPDSRGIRDYTRRYRHENSIIAADIIDCDLVRWVSLYRADPDHVYTEEERQLCALLFPHLIEALAINRLVNLEHLEPAGAMRRYHLAIADRRGLLYHSEPGFHDLLGREAVGTSRTRLPEAVLTALQSGQFYKGRAIVLLARAEGDLLFLKARPRVLADALSAREIQVAREVARGHTYKEIARDLQMSPSTARNHIHAIHAKLQVDNKASLTNQLQLIE